MIPTGYMLKNVVPRPEWIQADGVVEIYSVSNCVSDDFADYIKFWEHNGYWFFNSPGVIRELARREQIDVSQMKMFYYEVYEKEYDGDTGEWKAFEPEVDFTTAVVEPLQKELVGFDVVTFAVLTSAECSPLSCNSLATDLPVNKYCLFRTLDEAKSALERGRFEGAEPGPFRIFAVYTVTESTCGVVELSNDCHMCGSQ